MSRRKPRFDAIVGMLPTADWHAGELLDKIFAAIRQTEAPDQLNPLAGAFEAVAEKLQRDDPHADKLLGQILAATKPVSSPTRIAVFARAYKALAYRLQAADRALASSLAKFSPRADEPKTLISSTRWPGPTRLPPIGCQPPTYLSMRASSARLEICSLTTVSGWMGAGRASGSSGFVD